MQTKCTNCQKVLQVADSAAGKRVKCPGCNQIFVAAPLSQATSQILPLPTEKLSAQIGVSPKPQPIVSSTPSDHASTQEVTPASLPAQSKSTGNERQQLLNLLASYKRDIDKSIQERNEAMEMVDSFFNLFLERAERQSLTHEEQQEYRDTAQKMFELQKKFPLLSGFRDILNRCEKELRG